MSPKIVEKSFVRSSMMRYAYAKLTTVNNSLTVGSRRVVTRSFVANCSNSVAAVLSAG